MGIKWKSEEEGEGVWVLRSEFDGVDLDSIKIIDSTGEDANYLVNVINEWELWQEDITWCKIADGLPDREGADCQLFNGKELAVMQWRGGCCKYWWWEYETVDSQGLSDSYEIIGSVRRPIRYTHWRYIPQDKPKD